MLGLFFTAVGFGFLFNATPGAIFTESLRRGLRGGYRPALAVQIGSLAGDFVWAVMGLLGAAALFTLPYVEVPLALAGSMLLFWLSWQTFRDGLSHVPKFDPSAGTNIERSALSVGAALSLSNPMNITYWAGLGGTISALGVSDPGWLAFSVFLTGFMISSVTWCFIAAGIIAATRRFVGPILWKVLNIGCATGLAFFALLVLLKTVGNSSFRLWLSLKIGFM
jgi:chemosensory pili system protein ChpE